MRFECDTVNFNGAEMGTIPVVPEAIEIPLWAHALFAGVGLVMAGIVVLWFALAAVAALRESYREGPFLVFLILFLATFPWGALVVAFLEIRRARQEPAAGGPPENPPLPV